MKVCNCRRDGFYSVLNLYFQKIKCQTICCEVGVLKGENAKKIYSTINPKQMYLIDSWKVFKKKELDDSFFYKFLRGGEIDQEKVKKYYGGDLTEQSTFDNLYKSVVADFSHVENIEIVRNNSLAALKDLRERIPDFYLDYCYVDANHEYDAVLNEMLFFNQVLSPTGIFQLNDCCHSEGGVKQNLGVLEATIKFCKLADFRPVAITNTDWSDIILVSKKNKYGPFLDKLFELSNISYVEIPDSLLGAARNIGPNKRLSFV